MEFVTDLMKKFGLGPKHLILTGHSLGANVAAEVANAFGLKAVVFCLPMLCGPRINYSDLTVCNVVGDPICVAFTGTYNHLLPGRDLLIQYHKSFIGPSELHSGERLAMQTLMLHTAAMNEVARVAVKEAKEEVFRDSSPRGADGKLKPIGLSMKVSI